MKKIVSIIFCYVVGLTGLCSFYTLSHTNSLTIPNNLMHDSWSTLLHCSSNAYLNWKSEFFTKIIEQFLSSLNFEAVAPLANLILIFSGLFLFFSSIGKLKNSLIIAIMSLTSSLSVLMLFGQDNLLLSILAYLPWFFAFSWKLIVDKTPQFIHVLCFLFFSLKLVQASNHFSLFLGIFVIALCYYSAKSAEDQNFRAFTMRSLIALSFFTLISCIYIAAIPAIPWPDYPNSALLIEDDGLPGIIRTLLGVGLPIPVIDRPFEKYLVKELAMLFTVIGIFLVIRHKRITFTKSFLFLALFLISFGGFILLPEQLASISPIATLSRTVPNLNLLPLGVVFGSVLCLTLLMVLILNQSYWFFGIVLAVLFAFPNHFKPINRYPSEMCYKSEINSAILASPSHSLLALTKIDPELYAKQLQNSVRIKGLKKLIEFIDGSHKLPIDADKLFDHNPNTRISSQTGSQTGNEWFLVKFKTPLKISEIELSPGKFITDFPRGINVSIPANCSSPIEYSKHLEKETLFKALPWLGPIKVTPQGYPYYGYQQEVRIALNSIVETQCLLVEQIGSASSFDWSIAELKVFSPLQPSTTE